eukprot:3666000-Rhodomonas_salina.1
MLFKFNRVPSWYKKVEMFVARGTNDSEKPGKLTVPNGLPVAECLPVPVTGHVLKHRHGARAVGASEPQPESPALQEQVKLPAVSNLKLVTVRVLVALGSRLRGYHDDRSCPTRRYRSCHGECRRAGPLRLNLMMDSGSDSKCGDHHDDHDARESLVTVSQLVTQPEAHAP